MSTEVVRIKDPCEKRLPPLVLVTWYRIFADALLYIPFTGESEKAPQVIFLFFISFIAAIQSPSHGAVSVSYINNIIYEKSCFLCL